MHRCLCVQEMLLHIISFCQRDDISEYTDLLNIALTCRAFYEPAMDALWYTLLMGIGPLLLLLPTNVSIRNRENGRDYFLVEPPAPSSRMQSLIPKTEIRGSPEAT